MKMLILKDFEIYSNKNLSNQVLRKLVKLHNFQNVNQYDYINVSRHSRVSSWVFFFVQKSKVSLKISLKFPSTFFDNSKCCFFSSLFNCNRPITRYLSNHSFLQYTVIKNKLEDFLCHSPSSH